MYFLWFTKVQNKYSAMLVLTFAKLHCTIGSCLRKSTFKVHSTKTILFTQTQVFDLKWWTSDKWYSCLKSNLNFKMWLGCFNFVLSVPLKHHSPHLKPKGWHLHGSTTTFWCLICIMKFTARRRKCHCYCLSSLECRTNSSSLAAPWLLLTWREINFVLNESFGSNY